MSIVGIAKRRGRAVNPSGVFTVGTSSEKALHIRAILFNERLVVSKSGTIGLDNFGPTIFATREGGWISRQRGENPKSKDADDEQQDDCEERPTCDEIEHKENCWLVVVNDKSLTTTNFNQLSACEADCSKVVPTKGHPLVSETHV